MRSQYFNELLLNILYKTTSATYLKNLGRSDMVMANSIKRPKLPGVGESCHNVWKCEPLVSTKKDTGWSVLIILCSTSQACDKYWPS